MIWRRTPPGASGHTWAKGVKASARRDSEWDPPLTPRLRQASQGINPPGHPLPSEYWMVWPHL